MKDGYFIKYIQQGLTSLSIIDTWDPQVEHLAEAIQYRSLDREEWAG